MRVDSYELQFGDTMREAVLFFLVCMLLAKCMRPDLSVMLESTTKVNATTNDN